MDLVLVLYYIALGAALALLFTRLSGRPLSFHPADVAPGLLIVAVPYLLQAMGASFDLGLAIVVVATGLWYGWRRFRTHPA